jgi:hypothetical protein
MFCMFVGADCFNSSRVPRLAFNKRLDRGIKSAPTSYLFNCKF